MRTYVVEMQEVHKQLVVVEADSEQDAIKRVSEGEGEYGNNMEYSRTLDTDTWTVTEDWGEA